MGQNKNKIDSTKVLNASWKIVATTFWRRLWREHLGSSEEIVQSLTVTRPQRSMNKTHLVCKRLRLFLKILTVPVRFSVDGILKGEWDGYHRFNPIFLASASHCFSSLWAHEEVNKTQESYMYIPFWEVVQPQQSNPEPVLQPLGR